jgi:hypothetical protein
VGVSFDIKRLVGSRTTPKNFQFEQKQDLFHLCFGLFRETKNNFFFFFQFVLVVQTYIKITERNRTVLKQTETNRKKNQNNPEIF